MKTILLIILGTLLSISSFSQKKQNYYSNVEQFIYEPGKVYNERFLIYNEGKNFQNPFRKLSTMLVKYKDFETDSVMYGIRFFCVHDYPSSSNISSRGGSKYKIFNRIIDIDEIQNILDWIIIAQNSTGELEEYETISYVSENSSLMFGVFKENRKLYFRLTFNKYDFATAIFFNLSVLNDLQAFLDEVRKEISNL